MLSRPVRYDKQEKSIIGFDKIAIAFPFQKVGLPDSLFHSVGEEIAECLNAYIPPTQDKPLGLIPAEVHTNGDTPLETHPSATPVDPGSIPKKKRGRPRKVR